MEPLIYLGSQTNQQKLLVLVFSRSSLINDASHDLWVKNWLSIEVRGLDQKHLSQSMIIGLSSSGYSKNICNALDYAVSRGIRHFDKRKKTKN